MTKLSKFDMRTMRDYPIVVIIGRRASGKSFLTKDILYHKRDIPIGTVISNTEKMIPFYSDIIPPIFIHDEYNPIIVSNFIKRQKKMVQRMNNNEENIDPRTFIVFDDCLYDNTWTKDKNITRIFINGRSYWIMYILAMQYSFSIPPIFRGNTDYLFIFRENNMNWRRKIHEQYGGMFSTFEMFSAVMDKYTNNYQCLVIDNSIHSDKIEDCVFWYRADDHGNFKISPKEVWDYSERNFVDHGCNDNEVWDLSEKSLVDHGCDDNEVADYVDYVDYGCNENNIASDDGKYYHD